LGLFLQIILTDYFVFLIIFCLALASLILKKTRFTLKEILYFLVTLGTFIVFFSLSNIYPKAAAGLILERFYLLPLGMFVIGTLKIQSHLNSKAVFYLLLSASIINTSSNLYRHFSENNLAQDDFLQRHYTYMLESLPKDAILIIGGDTHVFSLYYLQEILNIRKDVTILTPNLYPYPWYRKKIQTAFPQKNFSRYEIKSKFIHENIDHLIISPNIEHFPIFADAFLMDLVDFKKYHIIHRSIVVEIKKGPSEPMFDCSTTIKAPHFSHSDIYQSNLEIFLWYGSCDYLGGLYHLEKKNNDFSLFMLKRAMEKIEYSDLYHRAYCEALILTQAPEKEISECYKKLQGKTSTYPYRFTVIENYH
jgi:hypothetical protein